MTIVRFGEWELSADAEATRQTYQNIDGGIADGCPCNECRNFVNYRESLFPAAIMDLFKELGIDYRKECENMHYQKLSNGLHQHHFWFHFKGKINFAAAESALTTTSANSTLAIDFGPIQQPTFFEDIENLIQVEFYAEIPWTIEKELEGD
jgi:hypothetical protein